MSTKRFSNMEKLRIKTKYTFKTTFFGLFNFSNLFGSRETNMEALLSEHFL